jgi:hypothetical protein
MSYLSNSNSNNQAFEAESLRTDEDALEFEATISTGHEGATSHNLY